MNGDDDDDKPVYTPPAESQRGVDDFCKQTDRAVQEQIDRNQGR